MGHGALFRKFRHFPCMGDFVREVHKIGDQRSDSPGGFQCLLKVHVSGMGAIPQGIKNQDLRSTGRLDGILWNPGTIREVGKDSSPVTPEYKTRGDHLPVRKREREYRGLPELETAGNFPGIQAQVVFPRLRLLKSKGKSLSEGFHGRRRCKNGHPKILHLAEAPHVIKPHDVIGVMVSEESGIEAGQSFAKALGPEIRCRVDDKVAFGSPDKEGGPGPVITAVG